MPIRAVIWDLGGVILRTTDRSPRQHLAARLGMTYDEIEQLVFNGESGRRAQRGDIQVAEHWENIRRHFRLSEEEILRFQADFWGGDILDTALVDYIRSLRGRYKTGLLSNAFSDLRAALIDEWKCADAFDAIIVSSEIGITKPDARIYQKMLALLEVAPQEAVFIDDFAHNIEGARAVGLHAILFRSPEQIRSDLDAYLRGEP